MATLGIDIGGTNLSLGLVEDGRIIQEIHTPSFRPDMTLGETLDYLAAQIEKIFRVGTEKIGIGVPSVVDVKQGIVYDTQNIPSWTEVPLKEYLEKRFDVPVDVTVLSHVKADASVFSFVSDGSKITLNMKDGKAYSDKKKGVHSRYVEYNQWLEEFLSAYRAKADSFGSDKDAADAYFAEKQAEYIAHHKATVKANKDNIVGLTALRRIQSDDAKEMLSLINSFSSEMQKLPELADLKKEYEALK